MISKYNVYYRSKHGNIIYNLLTRKVKDISYNAFENLINNNEDKLVDIEKEVFYQYGYIIEDGTDEYKYLLDKYNKCIYKEKLELTIMASTACNFKCKYCYEEFRPVTIDYEFVDVITKFVKRNIIKYHGIYIEWFGGEPLIARDRIIDLSKNICEISKNEHIPYISSITTNGYLLDFNTFNSLLNAGIRYFQVTIDGDEKSHNKLRPLKNGGDTYQVIFNNLKDIKNNVSKYSYFSIVIRNNIFSGNKNQVEKFIEVFESEFSDDDRFKILNFTIKDWGGSSISLIKNELLDEEKVVDFDENRFSYSEVEKDFSGVICSAAKENGMVIDPEYNLYKCSHYIQEKKCEYKDNAVGVIKKNGNMVINEQVVSNWNIRNIDGICKKCSFLPYCLIESCPIKDISPKELCMNEVKNNIYNKLDLHFKLKKVNK